MDKFDGLERISLIIIFVISNISKSAQLKKIAFHGNAKSAIDVIIL